MITVEKVAATSNGEIESVTLELTPSEAKLLHTLAGQNVTIGRNTQGVFSYNQIKDFLGELYEAMDEENIGEIPS